MWNKSFDTVEHQYCNAAQKSTVKLASFSQDNKNSCTYIFSPLPMQVLGKRTTFMVFYAHRKILGKTYKMWTAALFLNPKKNWIFNFKIEISIFSLRTQNWDSDISKLRFRYFKIEISILAPISKKLRFRDFEREISILRSKLIFRALSIKSIVIRNFWEPMVRAARVCRMFGWWGQELKFKIF